MKNRSLVPIALSIMFVLINSDIFAAGVKYNRDSAVNYAKLFSSSGSYKLDKYMCYTPSNPKCENYNKGGGTDCANFISQALIDGGFNFDCLFGKGKGDDAKAHKREFVEGSVVIGKDAKTTGIRSANDLYTALEDSFCFKKVSASEAKEGNIAAWRVKGRNWVHHVVMLNQEGYYAGHTTDVSFEAKQKPGDYVDKKGIEHVVSFYHFQDDDKCRKCDQDQKTCKAELVAKCNKAENCIPETGACEPKCKSALGRCSPKVSYDVIMEMCLTGQGGDCPDETFTVGSGIIPQPAPEVSRTAEIGILESGFTYDAVSLLQSFNETARIVQIGDLSAEMAKDMPLLIIPSGGLYGMEKSEFFKVALDEYVKQGGAIFVLSQQHGYEYSAIPGGLGGYGWSEDQSCQTNSSYIDTWHPVLAGQTRSTPSINVDGYFTQYPDNAIVLLRRASNGQAALLLYPYGSRYVIATSAYTDSAYTRGEALEDEKKLMRDIVTWAKYPASLPEARQGESITLDLPIQNTNDSFTSVGVDIVFHDPDGNFLKREPKQPLSLPPGEGTLFPVAQTIQQDAKLGIYQIKHELYTEDWILWPSEENPDGDSVWTDLYFNGSVKEPSGRFVVSSPPSNPYKSPDFNFSVQSDAEYYALGTPATFTFILWNNTDTERQITVWADLSHHQKGVYETVSVPPRGSTSFNYILDEVKDLDRCFTWFFDETGRRVGFESKGIWMILPSVKATVATDKKYYAKGETVTINSSLKNNVFASWQPLVKVTVTDPLNTKILEDSKIVALPPYGVGSMTTSLTLPTDSNIGAYYVRTEVWHRIWQRTSQWASATEIFVLPDSQISVTASLPSSLTAGANPIAFFLNNMERINVNSGILDISLGDPDGIIVDSQSHPFTLAVGESKTLNIPVLIPSLKFGRYRLTYVQSDETKTGAQTTIRIPNTISPSLSLDKPFFRIRETANLTVDLANTGKFVHENLSVSVSVPDAGYSKIKTVSVSPNQNSQVGFSIPIPDTVLPGQHNVDVAVSLPSGSSLAKGTSFTVPESKLAIVYSGTTSTFAGGDIINLAVENTGGVDTTYSTERLSIKDGQGVEIYHGSVSSSILAGESKSLVDIQLPLQVLNGTAILYAQIKDDKTGKSADFSKILEIIGLSSDLQTRTDKEAYFKTEPITGISTILNGPFGIRSGNLNIRIVTKADFVHFLPKTGWWPFIAPYGVAVGPDGSIYVADTYNCRIQKFNANNEFIAEWGGYGSEDGQFDFPEGIAAVGDGSVYVSDAYGNRIQKFDGNGNFITKWGTEGSGNGEFRSPKGIAVGPDGSVYVADSENSRVQKFRGDGTFIAQLRYIGAEGRFGQPSGVAVGPDNSVYVADSQKNVVAKFDSMGKHITHWGSRGVGNGQFRAPSGVTVGSDGLVYVVDTENTRIQKFDSTGNFIMKWGSSGSEDGAFRSPCGIAVTSSGFVYVADTWNNRIQKFDSTGNFLKRWGNVGNGDGEFAYPQGIAIGSDGSIYVSESGNNRIQKFDGSGNLITKWGSIGSGNGEFDWPLGIAIGSDGSVYVADALNYRIQKFDSNGNFVLEWGSRGYGNEDGKFDYPYYITVGPDGSVYVTDYSNSRVQKFDGNGTFITKWGVEGSGDGEFSAPEGIAVSPDGSVYVADTVNCRVQKFDSEGNFIRKWGDCGGGDGNFSYPEGIAVGSDGSVYVTDSGNYNIQKFDSDGNFIMKWESTASGDGAFYNPAGIAIGPDGSVFVADYGYNRIQRTGGGNFSRKLFETNIPTNQSANTTQDYITNFGALDATGKLYLQATLRSSLGQTIAQSSYPFYIVEGDTVLLFNTDKKAYRPGETVTITEKVQNRASIDAIGLVFSLSSRPGTQSPEVLYTETFNLIAGGSHPLTVVTTADSESVVTLSGKVSQNESTLVGIEDQYEVARPSILVSVIAPDLTGNDPFNMNVEIKNTGKVDAMIQLEVQSAEFGDSRTITTSAGETKLVQYQQQIGQNTDYAFTFTGDLEQTLTKIVYYGLAANITMNPEALNPEGNIGVPVTITNTGQLAETIEVNFELSPGAVQVSKSYYLPAGASATDTLYFNLPEGNYQITASIQLPTANAQASISVRKENQVEMVLSTGAQIDGLIPVYVNLTNIGYNDIGGSVVLSLAGQTDTVWNSEQTVSQLPYQNSQILTFYINPSAFEPGPYTINAQFLNTSGQQIALQTSSLTIQGPIFQIAQVPSYQVFNAGQEATFVFRVKNDGNQEAAFDLRFKAYDLIDLTQKEWLKPGEEKPVLFSLLLPEDLEERDYFGNYELKGHGADVKGQVKYRVAGINLNVNATLGKQYYTEGETAHLAISIQSPSYGGQSFFTRVNYNGYESQQPFILSGSQTLFFDIPLTKITGEKLFYGIYHESGRSIHLNSLYIHKAGELLTIATDKQVYNPSETVVITINSQLSPLTGPMTLTAPSYTETFAFTGNATKSFTLPSVMTAGTYFVNATLEATNPGTVTATHPFDVAGIQVKVLECQNDKGKYASSDTITTNFSISSNTAIQAILKAWIVDPRGQYASAGENNVTLSSSENLLYNRQSTLSAQVSGIHRLVYGIYTGDLMLVSGSEAFDVGDAVLLGISTDRKDYPSNTEPVNVTVSLFGSIDANLQLELDGSVVKSEPISLNGYQTYTTQLQNITPGPHTLKGILTAGGLTSTKETSFTYALAYMPKPQISASPAYVDFGGINLGSSSTQTVTLSSTGNVGLVIGTITLSGGDQGEFSILNHNCSGRTIMPTGNCTLDILFSPGSLGAKSALLSIPSNATEMPTLYLSMGGTGVTTLNVSINPGGSGRVTGTGIDCPGDCVETYSTSGATVQLTATPSEGYQFVNWFVDTNQTENPITVNMDTHRNVTANFTSITYTINATAGSGGIISPSGLVTASHGGSQTFVITPNPGYHVADVRVDGVLVGTVTSYTFSGVTSNHTIEAFFAVNQYTITATAGPSGIITPSGAVSVNYGGSQLFTITPEAGYHVGDVKVDTISVGPVTTFTFDNVTSNHAIEVTFALNNSPPVANAGPDQNVMTGQAVTLNGSKSYDPEGAMITFRWTFVEAPAGSNVTNASLSDRTSAKPQFTPDLNGTYRLELIVNDGALGSDPDEVIINAATPNVAPNANAGPDQNVITGSTVQLDGSSSSDPDNRPQPLSYLWSFAAKPAGILRTDNDITGRNTANASFVPDVDGIYELRLTVSDGDLSSEDTLQIIATLPNVPPNANAGADITISSGGTAVLNGSASNDPDQGPQPLTYLWTFVAVPTGSQLVNGNVSGADTVSPSFTPDVEGTYVLQLKVYDGQDAGFDNVAVTVRRNLGTLGRVTVWLGLKNSDDQGTHFDLKVELLKNGVIIATGQTIDIRGITRNPRLAKEATVAFGSISDDQLISGDILSVRIWTKVTASGGRKTPSGGHSNAVGLRLYYDGVSRPSRFGAKIAPDSMRDYFLHSHATSYFLDPTSPTSSKAKHKDSRSVNRKTWKEIGTWSLTVQ